MFSGTPPIVPRQTTAGAFFSEHLLTSQSQLPLENSGRLQQLVRLVSPLVATLNVAHSPRLFKYSKITYCLISTLVSSPTRQVKNP